MRSCFIRLFLAVGMYGTTALAQQTAPHANSNEVKMSTAEQAVWEKEEAYWRIIKANDREALVGLRDERFVGWPRVESQPIHKNNSFGALEGRKLLDYKLERLSIQEYGQDVVITFYRATVLSANQDGTDEHTIASRITHTWLKEPQGWRIIGGMSAEDELSILPTAVGAEIAEAKSQHTSSKPMPLILEKEDGEHRVWRPIEGLESQASRFTLKVDPRNAGSAHLVFGTEDLPSGENIETHRHPGSDEILFLQNGFAKVSLGDTVRDVHGGSTVFIPAGTWVSVSNTGKETLHLLFIFSAPGFEEFMRAESVREGEKVLPLTKAEDAAIAGKHAHAVIYKEP